MAWTTQGKAEFAARVARIETRGGGVAEVFNADRRHARLQVHNPRRGPGIAAWFLKLPLALTVGALSFVLAQYLTFRIGEIPEEFSDPDYILAAQSVVALLMVLFAKLFFNLNAKTHLLLCLAGLAAGISMSHNLVHIAPEPWAQVFSTGWVEEVRAQTRPGTLYFRGTSIPLSQLSLG
ncbi:hypothetical protein [Marimonas arenosa]|uniref:Uncharacterized protein n=1 Tax=Marimonas arenosa TaxID=1795305 RepID=A0AAE4B2V9_9RHOB|nr:hypothetical protein [Marimonas arenosa]MDQ2088655.1 hypothetical protein [Marimonas arenosa]